MMKPTMQLRWKIRPGPTEHMQPILQQLWEWEFHHDYASAQPPKREWRDVLFECSANNEFAKGKE